MKSGKLELKKLYVLCMVTAIYCIYKYIYIDTKNSNRKKVELDQY